MREWETGDIYQSKLLTLSYQTTSKLSSTQRCNQISHNICNMTQNFNNLFFRNLKMGRTHAEEVLCRKSSPAYHSFLPHFKIRNDKLNIAKISVTKLSKIVDPQSKLRKAVLINNTLKHLQKHSDLWHLHPAGGIYPEAQNNNTEPENEEAQNISEQKSTSFSSKCGTTDLLPEKNTLSEDMLTLYDDIVNDIFGNSEEKSSDLGNQKDEQQEKENVIDNYKENYLLSPYSYNSFLSELYTVSSSNEQLHV